MPYEIRNLHKPSQYVSVAFVYWHAEEIFTEYFTEIASIETESHADETARFICNKAEIPVKLEFF